MIKSSQKFWVVYVRYRFIPEQCGLFHNNFSCHLIYQWDYTCFYRDGDYLNLQGKQSQLRYLDLSGISLKTSTQVLLEILSSCHSLEKLSLSHSQLYDCYIDRICHQNGQTLKVLDLQKCRGLSLKFIQDILKFCTKLREVDFADNLLKEKSFNFIVNNITPNIEKLRLGGIRGDLRGDRNFLKDEHIRTLVTRCNKISALSLNSRKFTKGQCISILNNFNHEIYRYFLTWLIEWLDWNVFFHSIKFTNYFFS